MGAKKSKAAAEAGARRSVKGQESATLEKPWRQMKWSDKDKDLQFIKNYKPQTEGQQLRILLLGPHKAGKSSFINSVQSVLDGRINNAPVNTESYQEVNVGRYLDKIESKLVSGEYVTRFTTYKIANGPSNICYPFVFNEMMGLCLTNESSRVEVNDIKHALEGHVKDGYRFNPAGELSKPSPHYNDSPTINDKVHILVCVLDANRDDTKNNIRTLQDIRLEASQLGIPQLAIFTQIDKAFPEIKEDVKNTYRSKKLLEKMQRLSADVGIPMNCIFAIQNCFIENDLGGDIHTLFLNTLRYIIQFGDDFLNSNNVQQIC